MNGQPEPDGEERSGSEPMTDEVSAGARTTQAAGDTCC